MSQNQFAELLQRARREKQAAHGPAAAAASVQPLSLFDQCTPCSAAHSIGRDMVYVPGFLDADAASSFAAHIEASAASWGDWVRLHRRSIVGLLRYCRTPGIAPLWCQFSFVWQPSRIGRAS